MTYYVEYSWKEYYDGEWFVNMNTTIFRGRRKDIMKELEQELKEDGVAFQELKIDTCYPTTDDAML